jgi:hypothetical protein
MMALGANAVACGLVIRFPLLAALGLAATALATTAFVLHRRLGGAPARTRAARSSRARAEMASWSAVLPLAAALVALAVHPAPRPTDRVSGKPAEVRSEVRWVIMPGDRTYVFHCGSQQHPRGDGPALARWKALPRWPEPERVEMEVVGDQIVDLRMDGQVIVDKAIDNTGKDVRVTTALAGVVLAFAAIIAIRRRIGGLSPRAPKAKQRA